MRKERGLTHSHIIGPYSNRKKSQKQRDNPKTAPKTYITIVDQIGVVKTLVLLTTKRIWNKLRVFLRVSTEEL